MQLERFGWTTRLCVLEVLVQGKLKERSKGSGSQPQISDQADLILNLSRWRENTRGCLLPRDSHVQYEAEAVARNLFAVSEPL